MGVAPPSGTGPTSPPTGSEVVSPGEVPVEKLITHLPSGLWLAVCDEETCQWKKEYASEVSATQGLRRHKGHHTEERERRAKESEQKPGEEKGPPTPDLSKMAPREVVAMYGQEGLETLKRQRLSEFLSIAPGVGDKTAQWILKQWDTDPSIRKSSNAVYQVLTSSGLRQEMAYRIANMLYTMEQEYQEILTRSTMMLPGTGGPQQAGPTPYWPEPSRQQPQQGWVWNTYAGRYEWGPIQAPAQGQPPTQPPTGYYWPPTYPPPTYAREPERERERERGYLTTEKAEEMFRRITKEERETDKLSKLEAAVVGLGSDLDNLTKRLESGELGRRKGEGEESPVTKDLKDRLTRMEQREKELVEDIHKAERAVDQKEAEHLKQELDRTHSDIEALRREIALGAGSKTVEGYKEDSMRVVGQGMQTIAGVAQTRRPAETIAGYIFGVPPGTPPQPPPESLGGLAGRLSPRFVTRVQ